MALGHTVTQFETATPSEQLLPPEASAAMRGKRLDPLWMLPKAWGEWAMQKFQGIAERDVVEEAEQFRDYWISIPGSRGVKLNWEATWRNRCRQVFANGKLSKKLSTAEHNQRAVEDFLTMTGIKPVTTSEKEIDDGQD